MDRQVIVLGMHRSGTSILSKLLMNLNIDMGEGDSKGDPSNVEGHNEDYEMLKINEEILATLDSSWHNPPSRQTISSHSSYIISRYKEYIDKKNGTWGVKEPRLSLFAEQIDKVLCSPKYIYMLRDEESVANSIKTRDGFKYSSSVELKKHYDAEISRFLSGKPHLVIEYKDLINVPETTLKSICDFLELEFNIDAISHIKDRENLDKAKKMALRNNVLDLFARAIKDPKKIFKWNNIKVIKVNIRRFIGIYLK